MGQNSEIDSMQHFRFINDEWKHIYTTEYEYTSESEVKLYQYKLDSVSGRSLYNLNRNTYNSHGDILERYFEYPDSNLILNPRLKIDYTYDEQNNRIGQYSYRYNSMDLTWD